MRGINSRGFLWHRFGLAIAAAFSVVLLIPLVQSYSYQGVIGYYWKTSGSPTHGERSMAICNRGGIIELGHDDSPGGPLTFGSVVTRRGSFFCWTVPNDVRWGNVLGTFWAIGYNRRLIAAIGETETSIYLPAWMLIALCGIAPSLCVRRHLRQRAKRDQRGFAVEPSNGV